MKRRFLRFSVRGLLGLTLVVGVSLGVWRFIESPEFVSAEPADLGKPIRVKGRLVQALGPKDLKYWVCVEQESGARTRWPRHAERSWLCLYEIETEVGPLNGTGEGKYRLTLRIDPRGIPEVSGTAIVTDPAIARLREIYPAVQD